MNIKGGAHGPAPSIEDRDWIDVNDESQLRFWMEKLGVSSDVLRRAIAKVGDATVEVRLEISRAQRSRLISGH